MFNLDPIAATELKGNLEKEGEGGICSLTYEGEHQCKYDSPHSEGEWGSARHGETFMEESSGTRGCVLLNSQVFYQFM